MLIHNYPQADLPEFNKDVKFNLRIVTDFGAPRYHNETGPKNGLWNFKRMSPSVEKSIITSTFIRLRSRLRGLASGIVGNDEDADDVLHDAFCKLWTRHKGVADELSAERLSYTIVRNTAIDAFRLNRNHPQVSIYEESIDGPAEAQESEDKILCDTLLRLAGQLLKPLQYRVFLLHDVENMGYPEVAELMGMTEANVRQTLSRARKQIREEYRKRQHAID